MTHTKNVIARRAVGLTRLMLVLPGLILASAGCGLLDTNNPDIVDPGNLESPEGAAAQRVGAIRDFGFVRDGDGSQVDTEGLVLLTGDLADEFTHSGFIPSTVEFDQRLVVDNNPSLTPLYFRLHVARAGAERAAEALQRWSPIPTTIPASPKCWRSPASPTSSSARTSARGAIQHGVRRFTDLRTVANHRRDTERAIARFDTALAHAGAVADPNIGYLAAVGKGRALLDRGLFTEAAQAVVGVPTDFVYETEHDPSPLSLANAINVYGTSGEGDDGGSISVSRCGGRQRPALLERGRPPRSLSGYRASGLRSADTAVRRAQVP